MANKNKRSLENAGTVGNYIDAIYSNNPKEEFLGEPEHHYDFTQSEEWANAHGYYPDKRGHRDDRVKKPTHPSHSSRGTWKGNNFVLTNKGLVDPNYIFFGLNDGGQDPQAILKYKDTYVIPEVTVTPKGNYINNSYDNIRLHFKEGGKSTNYITTGKAGYVPTAIDANYIINKISNLWNYTKTYLKNKYNGTGDGTFIDLSNKNVSRIKSNTKGVKTILTNEFVERNKNTIRKKKDFINTADTLLGDKKIPLSKISTYYGIENGKLKAGPINTFNDETIIVPNRAKYIGKIKEVNPGKPESKEFKNAINKGVEQYNKEHGYEADWIFKLLPFARYNNPKAILYSNLVKEYGRGKDAYIKASNKRTEIINNLRKKYSNLGAGELPYLVTENNDTIRGYKLNASPKVMFANEKGNAAFVSNIRNPDNISRLNKFLKNNPSYPIMIDNGRYSSYMDNFPNAEVYGGLNRPDNMFIIGTTNRLKHKDGGSINITPSKRGTFTAAATKHRMGVQEFASKVLRNKDSYSPTMVKKANFARNASKWH